ncbi:MAG TPA: iron-containing alcohol dehydrogenase [Thermoplasmata archaeon]|nr:iron-containing alcohol dehydrogenase [Thermoplasmata archaeon]
MKVEEVLKTCWISRLDRYRNPPLINFGVGSAGKIGKVADDIAQGKEAIIVTDKGIEKAGLIKEARESLEEENFEVDVYASEAGEPTVKTTKEVIDAMSKRDYGLVVGIGGGSCMDKAKIGACLSKSPGELGEYLAPNAKEIMGSIPKIMIPTTSGTGSEVSNTAVVIMPHAEVGTMKTWITGDLVLAEAAVVDPSLTLGLPPKITAGSGFDALSHTAEAVLSIQANPISDALSLKAVELVAENLRTAYHQGNNLEARWNMSLAAMIGGWVIGFEWVAGPAVLGHVASEGISPHCHIPHGEACGVLLPYVYYFNLPDSYAKRKLAAIARAMGIDVSGLSTRKAAERAITATFDLLKDVDLPTNLSQYAFSGDDIPMLVRYIERRAEEMYSMSRYNPRKATTKNLEEFFRQALRGREALGL